MLSRLGVIGDVHCESETLERVLDALETMKVEAVLCVGDLVDGVGDANATLRMLEARDVQCVAGNHERWFLDGEQRTLENATLEINEASRAFLEALPKGRKYATPKGNALLCHGVGEDDEAWLRPDTRGYALQDIPTLMVRVFPGLTVINAGTIHRKDEQTFMVTDFETMRAAFYSAAQGTTGDLIEHLDLPPPGPVE
jgi:hypothetical protein